MVLDDNTVAKDEVVAKINIDNVQRAAREKGASDRIHVKTYDDLDHAGTIKAFTWVFEHNSNVVADVMDILAREY